MKLTSPSSFTTALMSLALAGAVFVLVYAFAPLPHDGWATTKPGLQQALAAFDALHYKDARQQFAALARSGNEAAEAWLAYLDEHGFGAKRDPAAAIAEYTKAADAGSAPAARALGEIYLRGDGVLQDVTMARAWLARAADGGDTRAERDLGEIYAEGLGVREDDAQAYAWLDIAASHGDALAARERDAVLVKLPPAAVDHAEMLARETLRALPHRTAEATHGPAA